MADDLLTALRALANRWALKARDYARQAKDAGENEAQASYHRGYAEGYYHAATELAALLKDTPKQPGQAALRPPSAAPPTIGGQRRGFTSSAQPAPPAAPTQMATPKVPPPPDSADPQYTAMSVGEVVSILVFAGCQPRDVTPRDDNSLRATFSSWGSMMLHEQISRVQTADPRIIILNSGKLEHTTTLSTLRLRKTDSP